MSEHAELDKLNRKLLRQVGQAIADYRMIEEGDRIMVCLSGGKDSYALLDILCQLQAKAPIRFELKAVNLDQKQPGFPEQVLPEYLSALGVPFEILTADTYSVVKEKIPEGKTTCSLCSRLRRGILYTHASEQGLTKVALGHHRDDMLETLMLNMMFNSRLKAMPPKLLSDDQLNILIRPLCYVAEADLERFAELKAFPIIPCNLCGSQENLQRKRIKSLLNQMEQQQPGCLDNMARSLRQVDVSQLADSRHHDFAGLKRKPGQRIRMFDLDAH